MRRARLQAIRTAIDSGPPHMGTETEGIAVHTDDLEVAHQLGGLQPTEAVKRWLVAHGASAIVPYITPDVPETTVECNPPPQRSPVSTAAAQRLFAIAVDTALQHLDDEGRGVQLLHGATWRPPHTVPSDASRAAAPFKRLYYQFQIATHGDKVGAAAGDHLNLSVPWWADGEPIETTRKIVELAARMRLVSGALSIALTAASPLYYGAGTGHPAPEFGTALTPWESARLGAVWPGRTIMDVSGLMGSPARFRATMRQFAATGTLLSGRDVWLVVRPQPGAVTPGPPFELLCDDLELDLETPEGLDRARSLLHACFLHGPADPLNPWRTDSAWALMEKWRQELLERVITAPRNRVEIRTLETPPAFEDAVGYRTPYAWLRSVHAFLEVLFVYLSENPPFVEHFEYSELELQAAKANEKAVLSAGLDARVRWIPAAMHRLTARELLAKLLEDTAEVAEVLGRTEHLELLRRVADPADPVLPPAARIRREVAEHYGIDASLRHNARLLPDDTYPHALLRRSRSAMELELEKIARDLPGVPAADLPWLGALLDTVEQLRGVPT